MLLVCPNFPPSPVTCGVGDYTRLIVTEFLRRGLRITVAAGNHFSGPAESKGDLTVVRVGLRFDLAALWRVFRLARRRGDQLINVQFTPLLYGPLFLLGLPLLNLFVPVVVSYHSLHRSTLFSRLTALLLLFCCRGGVSTNEEITFMLSRYRLDRILRLPEIPIGPNILPAGNRPVDKAALFGVTEDCCILLFFGLFYPGKGVETLFSACRLLHDRNFSFRLILLGSDQSGDPDYLARLKSRMFALGLEHRVTFTGYLPPEEASARISAADLYVVPFDRGASIRRGSLMAGIVHGATVITTHPVTPSRFIRSEDFCLVPPCNPEALAEAVLRLWKDPVLRRHLSGRSRELSDSFRWDRIAADLIRAHEGVLRP